MDYRDQVMAIVLKKGPLLPVDVYKEIGLNVLMTSAVLSELVSSGKLKLTNLKIGGSPLYYALGQEDQLEKFSSRLKGPEKEAFESLKKNKILSDPELSPQVRVAIKDIKDYAKIFKYKENTYWKWFLASDEEAELEVKKRTGEFKEEKKPEPQAEQIITEPKKERKPKTEQKQVTEQLQLTPQVETAKQDEIITPKKQSEEHKTNPDDFFSQVKSYFSKNSIEIVDITIVKKNSELDLVIKMTTPVGKLTYYCKAKNKKKCNEGDLSSAYVKGEMKKLPVLFLTTGELTKKTQELLLTDFKNITVTRI